MRAHIKNISSFRLLHFKRSNQKYLNFPPCSLTKQNSISPWCLPVCECVSVSLCVLYHIYFEKSHLHHVEYEQKQKLYISSQSNSKSVIISKQLNNHFLKMQMLSIFLNTLHTDASIFAICNDFHLFEANISNLIYYI